MRSKHTFHTKMHNTRIYMQASRLQPEQPFNKCGKQCGTNIVVLDVQAPTNQTRTHLHTYTYEQTHTHTPYLHIVYTHAQLQTWKVCSCKHQLRHAFNQQQHQQATNLQKCMLVSNYKHKLQPKHPIQYVIPTFTHPIY